MKEGIGQISYSSGEAFANPLHTRYVHHRQGGTAGGTALREREVVQEAAGEGSCTRQAHSRQHVDPWHSGKRAVACRVCCRQEAVQLAVMEADWGGWGAPPPGTAWCCGGSGGERVGWMRYRWGW